MKRTSIITVLALVALAAIISACAQPASSESTNQQSPLATPFTQETGEATQDDVDVTPATAGTLPAASPEPSGTAPGSPDATPAATVVGATAAPGEENVAPETGAGTPGPTALPTAAYEAAVESWPVLLDPEYAFSLRYPETWVLSEADVEEDDAPLVRAYNLQPADWEGEAAPVTVEIVEGSQQDLAGRYPEFADAEEQQIGGNAARVATTGEDDSASATLHMFQNPQRENWWVVIRATVGNGVTEAELTQIADSFRWGELPEPTPTAEPSS